MPSNKLPNKEELASKLILNFTKPGVKELFFEKDDFYHIIVVVEPNTHIIDNLMELEETISPHNKVKFSYKEKWSSGELIWSNNIH
jgi:hypothetical protein